ncbi:MAG TPA: tautomerase family protein [Myxococcaceae bacterium]|nr:tautomerase family protein [Myxococcaceae bacterium]
MPLVRISLRQGKSAEYRRAVADSIHRALVETINVPEKDRFQIITEHAPEDLIYDPSYLDIARSDDVLLVQITISAGRSLEMKKALYARMVGLLAESPGIRKQDLFVSLIEVAKENWSFGNGVAQYA